MLKIARKIGPALLAVALVAACGGNDDGSSPTTSESDGTVCLLRTLGRREAATPTC